MRRARRTRAAAAVVVALVAVAGAGCGDSGGGSADDAATEEVASTRRSDNEAACDHLRVVAEIDAETARLSGGVARLVVVGAEAPVVLEAAAALAAHLETAAPALAEAYTAAAASAPEAVAAAIETLADASAETVPELAGLLRSAASAEDIARLYESFGAAVAPQDPDADPGAVEEVERYTSVICNIPSPG